MEYLLTASYKQRVMLEKKTRIPPARSLFLFKKKEREVGAMGLSEGRSKKIFHRNKYFSHS